MNVKQIIIVRKDLNMSKGKMAAQVSHASMAFLTTLLQNNMTDNKVNSFYIDEDITQWISGTFTKCVLGAKNKNILLKAITLAQELNMKEGIDYFLIKDNCYTELEPEEIGDDGIGRTLTCIGFRPMDADIIDKIGKKYQLYKE